MNLNFSKNYKYIPFLVFFLLLLFIHWKIQPFVLDDVTVRNTFLTNSLLSFDFHDFLLTRYLGWSSRTLIEFNWAIFLLLPPKAWKLIDSIIITFIPLLMVKLIVSENKFSLKKKIIINSLACFLTFIFLVGYYFTLNAGWISGTLNYIWPSFFVLLHFYVLKEYIFKKRSLTTLKTFLIYSVLIFSLFEAVSHEQLMLIIFAIYFFMILTFLFKKIKIKKIVFVNLFIVMLNGIYIFSSPGNYVRTIDSINVILPSFASFTLADKFYAGFSLFFHQILINFDIPTFVFFTVLAIFTFLVTKKRYLSLRLFHYCLKLVYS